MYSYQQICCKMSIGLEKNHSNCIFLHHQEKQLGSNLLRMSETYSHKFYCKKSVNL